jgi:hypothetical protein
MFFPHLPMVFMSTSGALAHLELMISLYTPSLNKVRLVYLFNFIYRNN